MVGSVSVDMSGWVNITPLKRHAHLCMRNKSTPRSIQADFVCAIARTFFARWN
jgi:hypothetical protein